MVEETAVRIDTKLKNEMRCDAICNFDIMDSDLDEVDAFNSNREKIFWTVLASTVKKMRSWTSQMRK